MSKKNRLVLSRALFMLIIIVSFGLIIVKEKGSTLFAPKVKRKINEYINENYSEIKNDIKTNELEYINNKFIMKITSNINDNYYFYIYYNKGNINDTYISDYLEGKTLLNNIEKQLYDNIKNKTNEECKVKITSKLNEYTNKVKERIIKEDNINELKIYYIEKEFEISDWKKEQVLKLLTIYIKNNSNNNIIPKYYKFILTDKKDITKSIEISNITNDFINNKDNLTIINDIINNNSNSKLLKSYDITYKYLN